MGTTTKTITTHTCDKCGKEMKQIFDGFHLELGGEPDQEVGANISIAYERAWASEQIICEPCGLEILRAAVAYLERNPS